MFERKAKPLPLTPLYITGRLLVVTLLGAFVLDAVQALRGSSVEALGPYVFAIFMVMGLGSAMGMWLLGVLCVQRDPRFTDTARRIWFLVVLCTSPLGAMIFFTYSWIVEEDQPE